MNRHPLQCACGSLKGHVSLSFAVNHAMCYCKDCQAFMHALDRADVLDDRGGTDIVQTTPQALQFSQGIGNLDCLRLTPNGLLRWYTRCCNTPIGNTSPNHKLSFVGLIHASLQGSGQAPLTESFGPVRMRGFTRSARGEPKPRATFSVMSIARLWSTVMSARLSGSYRQTPFFTADGHCMVTPRVLSAGERERVMAQIGA